MKRGLVLEGGAMRGMFTAGVIDVFLENDISFEAVVGVSAGAAFGCNYKSRQIGRTIRYNERFCKEWRYASIRSLIFTGDVFGAKFCYHDIPKKYDIFDTDTFKKTPVDFYVVATDLATGRAVYHKCESADSRDLEWMRASASMPFASKIVNIDGKKLLDGGVADSIPVEFLKGLGYDKNVVVLTRPRDYNKKKNKLMSLAHRVFKKYPAFLETMSKRHEIYNKQRELVWEEEKKGNAYVLCPKEPLCVSKVEHNPKKLREAYNIGRKTAEENLEKIKEFLK